MNDQEFDWTHIQKAIEEVEGLQSAVYDMIYAENPTTDTEDSLLEYYHHFYALMEKQSLLHTRLVLMKNEELDGLNMAIEEFCCALGKPDSETVMDFHLRMKYELKNSIFELTGQNMDDFSGIDIDITWD